MCELWELKRVPVFAAFWKLLVSSLILLFCSMLTISYPSDVGEGWRSMTFQASAGATFELATSRPMFCK